MTTDEVKQQLLSLDIRKLRLTKSNDEIYELICKICHSYTYGGLADLFVNFVDTPTVLRLVRTTAANYSNKMPRAVLFDIWRLLYEFGSYDGYVAEYFILDKNDAIRRVTINDLVRLKDSIILRLSSFIPNESTEELNNSEVEWIEEDDDFLTKEVNP